MDVRTRATARAILLTPQGEVLLIRTALPWEERDIWMFPGGGIKNDEDALSAVIREVYEETGGSDLKIQGEAWHQEMLIDAANTLLIQRYFLAKTERFIATPTCLTKSELEWIKEYRWWSIAELKAAAIITEPKNVYSLLPDLIASGLPSTPTIIGE